MSIFSKSDNDKHTQSSDTGFPKSDNNERTKTSDTGWQQSATDERDKYRSQSFSDGTARHEKIEINEDGSHSHTWTQYNKETGQYGTGETTKKDK